MDFLRGIQEQLGVGGGASSSLPTTTAPPASGAVPAVGVGGNVGPSAAGNKAGLLADWQSYQHDVEGGSGVAGAAGTVAQTATDIAQNLGAFFQQQYARVADTASAVASGTGQTLEEATGLPSATQLTYFAAFLGAGLLFLSLAVFVFLPMIILAPGKFALTFTLGCVSVLAALASLRGWRAQLTAAMQRDRLPFTAGYAASVLATLYAALVAKSYLLSLGCSGLQAVALCYYVAAYFPGGVESVRYWLSWVGSAAASCARGLFAAAR
jgi:hypothetical protein